MLTGAVPRMFGCAQVWREAIESLNIAQFDNRSSTLEALQARARAVSFAVSLSSFCKRPVVTSSSRSVGSTALVVQPLASSSWDAAAVSGLAVTPAAAATELLTALDGLLSSLRDAGACLLALHVIMQLPVTLFKRDEELAQIGQLVLQVLVKVRSCALTHGGRTACTSRCYGRCVCICAYGCVCVCVWGGGGELSRPTVAVQVLSSSAIDSTIAVAGMLALAEQSAFDAFKYCVASVAVDNARVEQVARVGMTVASVWGNQAVFLEECRRLRMNAVWWQRLDALGIRPDVKRFGQSDNIEYKWYARGLERTDASCGLALISACDSTPCVRIRDRTLLAELLVRSSFDIKLALEFCAAYGISQEVCQ